MPEFTLEQIQNYLNKLNMKIDTIYTIDDDCVFLKIHMTQISDFFVMYISSRYTIYKSNKYNCIEIKYVDLTETEEVAEDFANIDNEDDIEEDFIKISKSVLVTGTHFSTKTVSDASFKAMKIAKKYQRVNWTKTLTEVTDIEEFASLQNDQHYDLYNFQNEEENQTKF